jgi:pimeloyl-ACP methyl ester carboxylesterase
MADFAELPMTLYGDPSVAPDLTALSDEELLYLARAQEATARFCWRPYMHDPKLSVRLRRIEAPCLVVAGEADRFVVTEDYYERYAKLVGTAGAELVTLPGVGHRVEEEAPRELAGLIAQFSERAAGGSVAASKGGS